jgi:hypothetical protein
VRRRLRLPDLAARCRGMVPRRQGLAVEAPASSRSSTHRRSTLQQGLHRGVSGRVKSDQIRQLPMVLSTQPCSM